MNSNYIKELEELKLRMEKAEKFANKVPMFKEKILKEKITGEEEWLRYLDNYKSLSTPWHINRGFFKTGTSRCMTNNTDYHEGYFWSIYINTLCEFDSHNKYGLQYVKPVFYYDFFNTHFYCTDEQIEELLESLNEWKIRAIEQHKKDSMEEKIEKAKLKIQEAKQELEILQSRKEVK